MFPITVKFGSTEHNRVEYAQVIGIRTPLIHPESTALYLSTTEKGTNLKRTLPIPLHIAFSMLAKASTDAANHYICDMTRENLTASGFIEPPADSARPLQSRLRASKGFRLD